MLYDDPDRFLCLFCFFYFSERISRERELIEERCERRLEILKNLVGKTAVEDDSMNSAAPKSEVQICCSFQSRYSGCTILSKYFYYTLYLKGDLMFFATAQL